MTNCSEVDETVIVDGPEAITRHPEPKQLMRVVKVDLLRDSLDGLCESQGFETDLVSKVRTGILPQTAFCVVEGTEELVDLSFDMSQARCYINAATKEYYRPV